MTAKRMPGQIKFIIGNEAAERFSYYGMSAILITYLTSMLGESMGMARYHDFVALCYLLPLLGGYLSDRFLGKYRTIISLSLVYCAGHVVLSATEGSLTGTYVGLGLIALGAGGIKPCVSAHVGDQFNQSNKHLVNRAYSFFYWSINLGSLASTLLIPWVKGAYGFSVAFAIPGILMFVATFVFWLGRRAYVHVPPTGKNPHGFAKVCLDVVRGQGDKHPQAAREGVRAVFRVIGLFAFISLFWTLFHQHGSSWTAQAGKLDRHLWGLTIANEQVQALNPLLIITMVPLFTLWLFPALARRGFNVSPLRRMTVGMFLTSLSFVCAALLERRIADSAPGTVSVGWQFFQYFIITVAEILVSATGLEFAYTQAPRSMKSAVMSVWLLTVFVGNKIAAFVFSDLDVKGADRFWLFSGMMVVAAVAFAIIARLYKPTEYIEQAPIGGGKIPVEDLSQPAPRLAAAELALPPPGQESKPRAEA